MRAHRFGIHRQHHTLQLLVQYAEKRWQYHTLSNFWCIMLSNTPPAHTRPTYRTAFNGNMTHCTLCWETHLLLIRGQHVIHVIDTRGSGQHLLLLIHLLLVHDLCVVEVVMPIRGRGGYVMTPEVADSTFFFRSTCCWCMICAWWRSRYGMACVDGNEEIGYSSSTC